MRFSIVAVLALANVIQALPSPGAATADPHKHTRPRNSKVNGLQFDIDGTTSYFAGTNAYWAAFWKDRADVDLVMGQLKQSGLKVLRCWGFNDISFENQTSEVWFQSFIEGQPPVINTGPNGLQQLDAVVASAEKHGIKLIIPFVNNWDDYGGMSAYLAYYGGNASTWYTSEVIQAQYQTYIAAVVSRYKHSKAIFAWELANEARCEKCDFSIITNWATRTSAYIKRLDHHHMVTLGDEGWFNGGGDGSSIYTGKDGIDFVANLKIKDLDFGTFHMYPEHWSQPDSFANGWITEHAAACKAAGKPCILEEYGVQADNHTPIEGPWQATALSLKDAGLGADMFWGFGTILTDGQPSANQTDNFDLFYGTPDWQTLVIDHVAGICQ